MTELEPYRGAVPAPLPKASLAPAADTDGWIKVVVDVARLAEEIANTDFVPDAMRGKPAAVTAAILAGREMGVGPMTSLQHIHVIKGKPGQSAHLMRGLVLAKGHEIDYLDVSDTRALIRGRRAGETNWTEVEFTADQARRAKIDLGGYPADKLVARATARLCRRKFADVISGLAYSVEELQDGDAQLIEAGEQPPALTAGEQDEPAAPRRTAQRRTKAQKPAEPAQDPEPAASAPAPAPAPSGPPLPGEDEPEEPPAEQQRLDPNGKATAAQNRHMHALFNEAGLGRKEQRDDRLTLTGILLNRQIDTSAGLTVADAQSLIDALINLQSSGHAEGLAGAASDLLNEYELAELERQRREQEQADEPAADQ